MNRLINSFQHIKNPEFYLSRKNSGAANIIPWAKKFMPYAKKAAPWLVGGAGAAGTIYGGKHLYNMYSAYSDYKQGNYLKLLENPYARNVVKNHISEIGKNIFGS